MTKRPVYLALFVGAVIVLPLIQGSDGTITAEVARPDNPPRFGSSVEGRLSNAEILAHSNGWISALGYHPETPPNLTDGAPGYVVPDVAVRPADAPVFTNERAMNTDSGSNYQAETSISIHPTNPFLTIGSAIDRQYSTNPCNVSYRSADGGTSWTNVCPPGTPGVNRFDPSAAWAPDGTYSYLAAISGNTDPTTVRLWRSADQGVTFTEVVGANNPINDSTTSNDRSYVWVDHTNGPSRGNLYVTWIAFRLDGSFAVNNIAVRRSTDNGNSWSATTYAAVNNSSESGRVLHDPSLAPLPDGNVAVIWSDDGTDLAGSGIQKIMAARLAPTSNGGLALLSTHEIAVIPNDRAITYNTLLPNGKQFRTASNPSLAVDPISGKLYAVWAAYRTPRQPPEATGTQAGIYFALSSNGGQSWSPPTLVSPLTPQDQFMPWISVSVDGRVHITWGDCRNDPVNLQYDWYYTSSTNQGTTFDSPIRLSSQSSSGAYDPGFEPEIGDYSVNYSINGTVYATWTDNRNGAQRSTDVYAIRGTYPTSCTPDPTYTYTEDIGGIVHGPNRTRLNISCLDCKQTVTLPFPYTLYDSTFNSLVVGNNGVVGFPHNDNDPNNQCLASWDADYHILPFWDGLDMTVPSCPDCDVYVSTSGTAPNRIFNIEWIACEPNPNPEVPPGEPPKDDNPYIESCPGIDGYGLANFELRLYEGQLHFDVIVDYAAYNAEGATIGVRDTSDNRDRRTEYVCNDVVPPLRDKLIAFTLSPQCPPTPEPTDTPTNTPTPTPTPCQATPTPVSGCTVQFTDVPPGSTFYPYVRCMACQGFVIGYACGGTGEPCDCHNWPYFRPNNGVTRGQLSKMVSMTARFTEPPGSQIYEDVVPGSAFYDYVNRLSNRNVVEGYPCGTDPAEPCVAPYNRPYFRPNHPATRGQMAKIVTLAYSTQSSQWTFEDVPPGSTFHTYVERLVVRNAVTGYPCGPLGDLGEPCVPPENRNYYRPYSNATRGQAAKAINLNFYQSPGCTFGTGPLPGAPGRPTPGELPGTSTVVPTVTGVSTTGPTPSVPAGTTPTTPATPATTVSPVPTTSATPHTPTAEPSVPPPWPTVPQPLPTGYVPAPSPIPTGAAPAIPKP